MSNIVYVFVQKVENKKTKKPGDAANERDEQDREKKR